MNALLEEIIRKEAYKSDYKNITYALLFKKVEYEEAISALEKVIEEKLF